MNNSEAHQTTFESSASPIAETNNNYTTNGTHAVSETPLYDMFAKHIEQFIDVVQKSQFSRPAKLSNLANMFSFQLFLLGLVLIIAIFTARPPMLIILLGFIGIGCGFYSMATRDPLGMFIYSVMNFIGLVYCLRIIDYGYATVPMCFILLLLNQIKSIGYVIEFGKEKLGKRQVFESNI